MREARGPLILLAVLVVAAAVWFVVQWRSGPTGPRLLQPIEAVPFDFEDVPVRSPDLRVGPARVRGSIQDGFSSWLVIIACAEPEGCTGEFKIDVRFHTGSDKRRLAFVNRAEAPMEGDLLFQGLQDPSTPVVRIDELSLDVRSLGAPSEIPFGVID